MRDQKHQFALYYSDLLNQKNTQRLQIADLDLVHRVNKVLRLQVGDELFLFTKTKYLIGKISLQDKKSFTLEQVVWHKLSLVQPEIVVAQAVLKRENFENALYSCVELGATAILPILFAKSVNQKLNQDRIEKILINAAEQSKNFNIPVCDEPLEFTSFLQQIKQDQKTAYIYCDVLGQAMLPLVQQIQEAAYNKMVLIIGPEGDLTTSEKQQLLECKNLFCMRLTPTILRSFQATTVALGALRSLL